MAIANGTLSRAKSKPELLAHSLFKNAAQLRHLLAFLLITALTLISIKFNIELGRLSAVDETSRQLLPTGYALLDLSCLFLSGYVGIKSRSTGRKIVAWCWFMFLLSLSLWAAASFTLSVDARAASADLKHAIEQKTIELESINKDVAIWQANVEAAVNYKTKHQKTLESVQSKQLMTSDELHGLEMNLPNPTMAIYELIAPRFGIEPEVFNTLVRLLWAAALTLSPIVIMLLVGAELADSPSTQPAATPTPPKGKKSRWWSDLSDFVGSKFEGKKGGDFLPVSERKNEPETMPTLTENRATQTNVPALEIPPIKGHNGATPVQHLNGLKFCIEWLKSRPAGRITRAKLGLVSKIKNREGVTKIITALIDQGRLERLSNGQLAKPVHHLRLIK